MRRSPSPWESSQKQVINVTDTRVEAVNRSKGIAKLTAKTGDGDASSLQTSTVATGRRPLTETIGLENTKITPLQGGFIEVDGYMQTAGQASML